MIASGGAGNAAHVADALEVAQAALLASILHEDPARLATLRDEVRGLGASAQLPVRHAEAGDRPGRATRPRADARLDERGGRAADARDGGGVVLEPLARAAVAEGRDLRATRSPSSELRDDCDGDALLVRAAPAGPTCHTGTSSCFAPELWRTIAQRAAERPAGSYTTELLDAGVGACARKVGEEAVELTVAALDESDERVVEEAADLVYHLYVLLAARGLDAAQVEDALAARRKS